MSAADKIEQRDEIEEYDKIYCEILSTSITYEGLIYNKIIFYEIKSVFSNTNKQNFEKTYFVKRRYSDFEWLHKVLSQEEDYMGLFIPVLPQKHNVTGSIMKYLNRDENFICERKNDLNYFLSEISLHYDLSNNKYFHLFLQEVDILPIIQNYEAEKNKKKEHLSLIEELYKKYDHAQGFLDSSIISVLKKTNTSSYDATDIDVLFEKMKKNEDSLLKLINCFENLENFNKIFEDLKINNKKIFSNLNEKEEEENNYFEDSFNSLFNNKDALDNKNWIQNWVDYNQTLIDRKSNDSNLYDCYYKEIKRVLKKMESAKASYTVLNERIKELDIHKTVLNRKINDSVRNSFENQKFEENDDELNELKYREKELIEKLRHIESNINCEMHEFQKLLSVELLDIGKKFISLQTKMNLQD